MSLGSSEQSRWEEAAQRVSSLELTASSIQWFVFNTTPYLFLVTPGSSLGLNSQGKFLKNASLRAGHAPILGDSAPNPVKRH